MCRCSTPSSATTSPDSERPTMSYQEAYSSYHATNLDAQTSRASPIELVLLLTDGLLDELARARAHIVGKRYEQRANSINKCVDILNGLSSSLDTDSGGAGGADPPHPYEFFVTPPPGARLQQEPAQGDQGGEI